MKTTLPNTVKCLIKDLELQIDYLIGYKPSGNHWKMEYHIRKTMITATLADENTPPEIIEKIARVQDQLYTLYNKTRHPQGYINYSVFDYTSKEKTHAPIKVREWRENERKEYYI